MKIALYVHCFFPEHYHGTENFTLAVAKNLQGMGHEAVVVTTVPEGEQGTFESVHRYEFQGIAVYRIDKNHVPASSVGDLYYQPAMEAIHRELLLEIRPDIVHVTHLANHTAVLLEVAQELKMPVVATFTDFFGFCLNGKLEAANGALCSGPNPQRTNCFSCYVKAGIQHASPKLDSHQLNRIAPLTHLSGNIFNRIYDLPLLSGGRLSGQFRDIKRRVSVLTALFAHYRAAIAPTDFLLSAYRNNGFEGLPFHKINFGVDLDRKPKPVCSPSAPIRFGFIGQIAPHKGTADLVEAFCRLPKGSCELHIFGSEQQSQDYSAKIRVRCADFPVSFRGTFPGEQMRQVLDELDFLVIPSTWYENSPLVLLNALASHTPVIVSDVAGMTEFLDQGKNGYAFARGSVDDLERVMRNILENPESSRALSQSTQYLKTPANMTEEIVNIYEAIIGNSG